MLKPKLAVFDILKEALYVICTSHSFIALTFLTSLPFCCLSIYYEFQLQRTLVHIIPFIQQPDFFDYSWQTQLHTATSLIHRLSNNLIQLVLLYLPLHLLELCSAFVIIDSASKLDEKEKLREVSGAGSVTRAARFRGTLVTSIWVLILSNLTVVASIWLVSVYYILMRNLGYYNLYCRVLYKAACMALLASNLEWGAIWNMSIVTSILESTKGANSLVLSAAYLSRNSERRRGLALTLIFGVWGIGLRLACIFFRCHERRGRIVAEIGLLYTGNVVRWVAYMVYSQHCKEMISEKRVDEELG